MIQNPPITRESLALMLEQEAHPAIAEQIRAGADPAFVLSDGQGGVRKALRSSRYEDGISRNALATFEQIATGEIQVRG